MGELGAKTPWWRDKALGTFEITPEQQKSLFEATYRGYAEEVRRICGNSSTVTAYGGTDWTTLHPAIRTVVDRGVPRDRFARRAEFLRQALREHG